MVTRALFVRLEAKTGREEDVEAFLKSALPSSNASRQPRPGSPSAFQSLDLRDIRCLSDEAGREAHLSDKSKRR